MNETLGIIAESSIYVVGASFIAGSAFALLVMMLLDFMKLRREEKEKGGKS